MRDRTDPVEVRHIQALRRAGPRTLIVAPWDPDHPDAVPSQAVEVMIPISEIHLMSKVRKPGDRGTLVIPEWLAIDRELAIPDDCD